MKKPFEILLVEDNPDDVYLTEIALKSSKINSNLCAVSDGVEALNFLKKKGKYINVSEPNLILLDLNMPKKDGRETLDEIKSSDNLKHIPVIILTTSKAEEDIHYCYQHYANCYVTKPVDFHNFEKIMHGIENFWFSIVSLSLQNEK